jgi:cyclophilin family peptidyl-prolyl cis-trans isomerase/HEAT repeat protein
MNRTLGLVAFVTLAATSAGAQQETAPLTRDDSAVVLLVLQAEESRYGAAPAIANALRHRDPRIRAIAARAQARIADTLFAAREQHVMPKPNGDERDQTVWPEPAWKVRYRAVQPARDDCAALRRAATDAAWPVRQRAATMVRASCAADDTLVAIFRGWVDALPATTPARNAQGLTWQPAAYGLAAYTRLRGIGATPMIERLATHPQWQVRQAAARAAGETSMYGVLRRLARDQNDNVVESAIEWLAAKSGAADDSLYIAALGRDAVPSVRAAANALRGTTNPAAIAAAASAFERFAAHDNASERDVRLALLYAAGRAAIEDRAPPRDPEIPEEAVDLALGNVRYLRVEMAESSGGQSFVVRLRGDVAPIMAARVLQLARDGWYDNSTWQRVEYDFVLQGGGPGANEYVGYKQYFVDELGTVAHPRGSIGMSTRGHDSGDGQWFINYRDNPRLVRDFTVFGEVVDFMEVVDAIVEGDVIARVREVRR